MKIKKSAWITLLGILGIALVYSVWVLDHNLVDSGLEVLLYMIGYGDARANVVIRFILAVFGILLVGIFSSYITVIFIEEKSKLKMEKTLYLNINDCSEAYINIKTKHWELYDIEIKMMYVLNGSVYEESIGRYPYWKNNQKIKLNMNLERGGILYWYMQAIYENNIPDDLIIKIDFVNGKNNQSYCAINKYHVHQNFMINGQKRPLNHDELKAICGLDFNLNTLIPINKQYITYHEVTAPLAFCGLFNDGICASFNLEEAPINDFGMLLLKEPFNGNWKFFKNENYQLTFKVYTSSNIDLHLEIKSKNDPKLVDMMIDAQQELKTYTIDLSSYSNDSLQSVTEMCFTVFNKEGKDQTGEFYIIDCCMKKRGNEK